MEILLGLGSNLILDNQLKQDHDVGILIYGLQLAHLRDYVSIFFKHFSQIL